MDDRRCLHHVRRRAKYETVEAMIEDAALGQGATLGADKAYDAGRTCPQVARIAVTRCPVINGRTTRHPGDSISQCLRKRIEEPFGWIKAAARH